jgi:hypothetical protein
VFIRLTSKSTGDPVVVNTDHIGQVSPFIAVNGERPPGCCIYMSVDDDWEVAVTEDFEDVCARIGLIDEYEQLGEMNPDPIYERNGLLEIYKALHHFCNVFQTPNGTVLENNEYLAWCGVSAAMLEFEERNPDLARQALGIKEDEADETVRTATS